MTRIVARWLGWRVIVPEDRRPLGLLLDRFVAIDTETTGLDTDRDDIVSIAAVPFLRGEPADAYETLVNPGRPIPPTSTRFHGITDDMVATAPPIEAALDPLEAIFGDAILVAHGVAFDLAFIERSRRAAQRLPLANTSLCTMRLATALHPGWTDVTLDAVASRLGIPVVGRHTARGDALLAGAVLLGLLPDLTRCGCRTIADATWLQRRALL